MPDEVSNATNNARAHQAARATAKFKLIAIFLGFAASTMLAAPSSADTDFLARISATRKDVRWDRTTLVSRDFDGDGQADRAVVGYLKSGVVLAIDTSSAANPKPPQFLLFGISATEQAAICAVPAHLKADPLSCEMEDDQLPGCRESPKAWGLELSGGDCDPVNLYWDHDSHQMSWWRN